MKKFRPFCAGYIVLYVLALLCTGDAVYTLISQLSGVENTYNSSFALFSYLIFALAVVYVRMYVSTRVEIDDQVMRIVSPIYVRPKPGERRAMFIYRQGDTDMVLSNKRFLLSEVEKYGYIEDLKVEKFDKSPAGEKNKLFPVHEVAFLLKDGTRCHLNAAIYSKKQRAGILQLVIARTGIQPFGKLAEEAKL